MLLLLAILFEHPAQLLTTTIRTPDPLVHSSRVFILLYPFTTLPRSIFGNVLQGYFTPVRRSGCTQRLLSFPEDLSVLKKALAKIAVGQVLDGELLIDAKGSGGGGGLSENHENGFHADGTEGDV